MGSYHASIQEKLVQIIDEASAPMALQDIFNRMEAKIIEESGSFNAHDLALTEQHTEPALESENEINDRKHGSGR